MNKRGKLIILSGPSGVGKGTVREELFKFNNINLFYSISMTTRLPRNGEVDGREYYFVSTEEFEKQIKEGNLLEYNQFVGNYYGTPKDKVIEKLDLGFNVLLEIDVNGARRVKKNMPEAISIFLTPPSLKELEERIRGRATETEEIIQERLDKARSEIDLEDEYDYVVCNKNVNEAACQIASIITK